MSEKTKPEGKPTSLVKQIGDLADSDRGELLKRAKAAGPPIKQTVMVKGKPKEIEVYSLRPLLEKETD